MSFVFYRVLVRGTVLMVKALDDGWGCYGDSKEWD